MPTYAFLIGYDENGPYTDSFLDVTPMIGVQMPEYLNVTAIADRMGVDTTKRKLLPQHMQGMFLRARVTGKTMHRIDTDQEMTPEDLNTYMRSLYTTSEFKDFIRRSQI